MLTNCTAREPSPGGSLDDRADTRGVPWCVVMEFLEAKHVAKLPLHCNLAGFYFDVSPVDHRWKIGSDL